MPIRLHRRIDRPKPRRSGLSIRTTLMPSSFLPSVWPELAVLGTS